MNRTSLACRPCPRMSQVSQSSAASRASVVAEDVHAAPTTTSAPMAPPASTVRTDVRAQDRAGSRAPRRAQRRRRRSPVPPRSVAGQPTPATVTAAAASGRRAATSSAIGGDEAEDRTEDEGVHLRIRGRLEREEDLVEVDDPACRVAQSRREHALVAERCELPRLRAEGDPGCASAATTAAPTRWLPADERGHDRERGDGEPFSRRGADPRGSATRLSWPVPEAVLRGASYARATASSAAPRARSRDRLLA